MHSVADATSFWHFHNWQQVRETIKTVLTARDVEISFSFTQFMAVGTRVAFDNLKVGTALKQCLLSGKFKSSKTETVAS